VTTSAPGDIQRIAAAGDAALLFEFPQRVDPLVNARAIALAERIRRRCGTAIRDAVVGFATLTVYFDPLVVDAGWLEAEMCEVAASLVDVAESTGAVIEVPVCYGGELGPDLDVVAAFAGCTPEEVIARHCEVEYRVFMVGFVPGFAYLASVDPRIAAPRRSAPRAAVIPGSVGIAGVQTGIYPAKTPGGWNIVGRTPLEPYDAARKQPCMFSPGDTVRFRAVSRDVYQQSL
jgi:inhibitor of KinA